MIKKGNELFMYIESDDKDILCHWKTDSFPLIHEGRIGLRHMWTRSAQYANFRVSKLENKRPNSTHSLIVTIFAPLFLYDHKETPSSPFRVLHLCLRPAFRSRTGTPVSLFHDKRDSRHKAEYRQQRMDDPRLPCFA